jgi:hypothetical protein
MAGYIGSKASVTLVDSYRRTEADSEFVQVAGDTMTGNLITSGNVTANQFIGGGTIITVGNLYDATAYTTTSQNFQTATRFQITPTTSTSKLLGWFYFRTEADGEQDDGDMASNARVYYVDSIGSWVAHGSIAVNQRTETGTTSGVQEVPATLPVDLSQSELNSNGVWDVAIRHYEVYDAISRIDDGRLFYMEYEP